MALPDPTEVAACHEPPMESAEAASPPMGARIELRDYDPVWPQLCVGGGPHPFGPGRVGGAAEHVGSTSVSGLAAKPIIDIVLEVPNAAVWSRH